MAASDARPVCRKGVAWRLYFSLRTSAGALYTSWASQDSEVSLDGASFTDCTNEATEIGTSGVGYLDLTSSETNADAVCLKITTTGGLPYVVTIFPEEAGDYRADMTHISGDSVAADNLETACDGGAFNLGGGGIVAASVTGAVGSVGSGVTVTTNNDKSGYSLSQSFPTNFSSLAITGGGAVTAGTVSDKTGYSLSSTQTFDLTGNITGNLSGSVGSVASAITLPTIPADWITSSGLASSAVTEIQSGMATASGLQQVAAELPSYTADAVWDDPEGDHQAAGSMGAALSRTSAIKTKTDNLPTDPADASDIAAAFTTVNTKLDVIDDFLDTEVAEIKAKTDNLPSDPADASDIATAFSAVNTKLDTIDDFLDTEIAAMKVVTDKYGTMVVQDGLVYQFTTNALENGPAGGGGGSSTIAVYPLNATMPARVYDLNLTFYKNEDGTVVGPISVTSRNANVFEPVGLSGRTLSVRFVDYEGTELLTVANGDITVSGADNNQISFPVTSDLTGSVTETPQDQWHIWTLHDLTSGDNVLIGGKARVLLC